LGRSETDRHASEKECVARDTSIELEIRETKHVGFGVFTTNFIANGAFVLRFGGEVFETKDVPPECFAMQIDDDSWLCSDGSLLDDRVNHSCDPNTGFLKNDPALYALRDILPGEELTWDYSTSISERGWCLDCLCGSTNCRRVILPFGELRPEEKKRLRPIALQYLKAK
jgi:SET domain-containing protein